MCMVVVPFRLLCQQLCVGCVPTVEAQRVFGLFVLAVHDAFCACVCGGVSRRCVRRRARGGGAGRGVAATPDDDEVRDRPRVCEDQQGFEVVLLHRGAH